MVISIKSKSFTRHCLQITKTSKLATYKIELNTHGDHLRVGTLVNFVTYLNQILRACFAQTLVAIPTIEIRNKLPLSQRAGSRSEYKTTAAFLVNLSPKFEPYSCKNRDVEVGSVRDVGWSEFCGDSFICELPSITSLCERRDSTVSLFTKAECLSKKLTEVLPVGMWWGQCMEGKMEKNSPLTLGIPCLYTDLCILSG